MSQDVLVVCSSRGWTEEKHMLYLKLLEETFVSQLHDSEPCFKGLFNLSPRYCTSVKSPKQIVDYSKPDQEAKATFPYSFIQKKIWNDTVLTNQIDVLCLYDMAGMPRDS